MSEEITETPETIQTTEDILKDYTRDQLAQIVLSWNRHKEILQVGQKKYKKKPEVIERMKIKSAELYMKKHGITEDMRKLKFEKKTLTQAEKTAFLLKGTMPDEIETIERAFNNVAILKKRVAELTAEIETAKTA